MSHQSEIEKKKYRNWVKGGLAYKYLKQGLDDFADDVVKQEQSRILSSINCTTGTSCNQCIIERLRPIHACITNSAGNYECYWGQRKCNCLHLKKKKCRLKVCDYIMEEILKSHGSTPPTPNWANTDIQKWCTEPWEVAKCFINAPGYSDKTKAADIDISGILHVFINNLELRSHLACSMAGKNIFIQVRERRNNIFHSNTMEMEEGEVAKCIDDIVGILEDPKELRGRPEAQEAVCKLKQLKESKFIITINDEVDVCKEALMFIRQKSDELKQMIEDGKKQIDQDTAKAKENINKWQNDAVMEFDEHSKNLCERVKKLETNIPEGIEKLHTDFSERFRQIETDVSSVKERVTALESKVRELDDIRDIYKSHYDYVEGKQEVQVKLVKYYKTHCVRTSISPLWQQHDSIQIKDVYVTPEIEVNEEDQSSVDIKKDRAKKPGKRYVKGYHEIFHTEGQRHKKIYILGDVGTGKSTFCKMMIENWCNAVSRRTNESICDENDQGTAETVSSDINMANECDDVSQMGEFEFLFFIQLQYMPALKSDNIVVMIKELARYSSVKTELIDKIFQEDLGRCLIIADSLDEWTPPKDIFRKPHVSYGIPDGDLAKEATFITLSRPSAKGILNLKNSEIDLKLQLLGISSSSLKLFIERYISNTNSTEKSYKEFIKIMKTKQMSHVEKTPLLLQQLLWLYCTDRELGNSVSETYCQILNIMCGWSGHKNDGNDGRDGQNDAKEDKKIFLPENLEKYFKLRTNKRVLFLLGATAFDALTAGSIKNLFGRQHLLEKGLSEDDVTKLLQFGILDESNCFDPTQEDKQFSFIHMSYLEFFATLYVTSNENIKENQCFGKKRDQMQTGIDKLFVTCKTASDILQLSNVIKMVCGLSPILIGDLSKRISCIVNEDAHILYLRRHGFKKSFRNDEIIQIQRLLVICLKECGSFDKTMISISDLCINDIEPSPSLQRINTNDVISLSYEETKSKNVLDYLTQCKLLKHIYIKYVSFSYKELSFLSQQECVNQLTLRGVKVADTVQSGTIDLSNQKQLQILELISCMDIRISYLVTEHLEHVCIKDCPNVLDFKLLSNAIRLTDVYIEAFYRNWETYHQHHIIDMSRQNHLRTLTLVNNPGIVITELNVEHLDEVTIQYIYEYNNSKDTKLLSYASKNMKLYVKNLLTSETALIIPLLQKTTLRQVTLDSVKCDQKKNLHIDLSGHNRLQKLTLVKCSGIVLTGLNTEQLEYVHIDNSHRYLGSYASTPALEFELPSSARKLIELHLRGQTVKTRTLQILQQITLRQVNMIDVSGDQHVIHVDLSKLNHLQILNMSDCKNIKIIGLNTEQLETVHIFNCQCVFDFDISSNASNLSKIHLECFTGNMASLVLLVEHASLRHLTLKRVTHCLSDIKGPTHEINVDLSKQNNVQILELSQCKNITIRGFNIDQLKQVHIYCCKYVFDLNISSNTRKLSVVNLQSLTGNETSLVESGSIKQLTLKGVTDDEGQMHEIQTDLSKQNHLQILDLSDCRNIKISDLQTEQLRKVHIINCICVFDFDLSSNESKLSKINLQRLTCNIASLVSLVEHAFLRQLILKGVTYCQPDVEGQAHEIHVDLSKQSHLQILNMSDCKNIKIIGLNIEELTLIGLSEKPSLRQLTFVDEGPKHEIHVDLSKQDHLQICTLLDCQDKKKSYTEHFEWSQHENSPGILKIELSGNASGLTKFFTGQVLGDRYQFRKQRRNVIHTLHRLTTLTLQNVDIDANALTLIPEMVFLTSIFLENTEMSIYTWRAFVDSLLTLQQSVVTKVLNTRTCIMDKLFSFHANDEEEMKYHYVKDNALFKMTQDDGTHSFCFQRRGPE